MQKVHIQRKPIPKGSRKAFVGIELAKIWQAVLFPYDSIDVKEDDILFRHAAPYTVLREFMLQTIRVFHPDVR